MGVHPMFGIWVGGGRFHVSYLGDGDGGYPYVPMHHG